MRRRVIREKVLQALYAHQITNDPLDQVLEHTLQGFGANKDAYNFARQLVIETVKNTAELDAVIREKVANWDFSRIALIDRLILRMAICELKHFKEIPPKVTMNEAIELAKLFSTEKSGHFVNGVLDAVLDDLRHSGDLHKAGRGLYEDAPPRAKKPSQS